MQMKIKGIARYPKLMKAKDYKNDGNFKYSVDLLIHKSDPVCQEIEKTINEVIANEYPKGAPKGFKTCWSDLSESDNSALKDYMLLKVSTNIDKKPHVVDRNNQLIVDPSIDGTITGQIVWIAGGFGCYPQGGIKMYLNGVLLTGETGPIPVEALSSKPSVEEMFSDVIQEEPTASMGFPSATPVPTPPTFSKYQMTAKANGATRDQLINIGWSDEQLIEKGMMLPPNGITPSFH